MKKLIICPELDNLKSLSSAVSVFNRDPSRSLDMLIKALPREGNILIKTSDGDYDDLSGMTPILESDFEFYQETGKIRNLYFFIYSTPTVSLDRYKDFTKVYFVPSFYAWYEIKNTISENSDITLDNRKISKHFLSLNNRASWYRQSLYYYFIKHELLNKSYFSYRMTGRFGETFDSLFQEHHDPCSDVADLDFEAIKKTIPYTTDLEKYSIANYGDWSYGFPEYYNETFCSVICETYNFDYAFYTEKTFKAFKYQHPFFLYGAQNSLQLLKDMGFETFSTVFDESYDTVESPQGRFEKMCESVLAVSKWSVEELNEKFNTLKPILEHNHNQWTKVLPKVYQTEIAKIVKDIEITIENKSKYLV